MDINPIIRHWALDPAFLHDRMSFICGPRQIGKTTLVQHHLDRLSQGGHYYNWDSFDLKREFAKNPLFFLAGIPVARNSGVAVPPAERPWIAFDEMHKYPKWKNVLKGYIDEWKGRIQFVVTGSARLDFFRRSGDSLVGRYFLFRMNPLHPNDLAGAEIDRDAAWHPKQERLEFAAQDLSFRDAAAQLLDLSGFPEPLSVGTQDFYNRWKNDHIALITSEDVRDLSRVVNLQKLQTLVFLLPERVGSPLSVNGLRAALDCAHASVAGWLETLKKVYLVFDVAPFAGKLKNSVHKERKVYFWDWGLLDDEGKRFENYVAVALQRAVSAWREWGKGDYRLYYARTKDGREADFVVTEGKRANLVVECKKKEANLSPALTYFKDRLNAPYAVQVIGQYGYLKQAGDGLFVAGVDRFLRLLP